VGADRVRDAEDWVLEKLEWRRKDGEPGKVKLAVKNRVGDWKSHKAGHDHDAGAKASTPSAEPSSPVPLPAALDPASASASKKDGYGALATTAVLAYAIHKTVLLPVRIGLTVAITPRVVRTLRAWGWNIGNAGAGAGAATAADVAAGTRATTSAAGTAAKSTL